MALETNITGREPVSTEDDSAHRGELDDIAPAARYVRHIIQDAEELRSYRRPVAVALFVFAGLMYLVPILLLIFPPCWVDLGRDESLRLYVIILSVFMVTPTAFVIIASRAVFYRGGQPFEMFPTAVKHLLFEVANTPDQK